MAGPHKLSRMNGQSRSELEAKLRQLGYGELESFDYDPCKHGATVCGGLFTHLHVFVGGVQTERSGAAEIRPAGEPIDHGAPED